MLFFLLYVLVFVNGATDASNSVSSAVASRAISINRALIIASAAELIGVLLSTSLFGAVGKTVLDIASFPDGNAAKGLVCALISVILWSCTAWFFSLPTSESHGLISALAGASWASSGHLSSMRTINFIIVGTVLSVIIAAAAGFVFTKAVRRIAKNRSLTALQAFAVFFSAFMHGAQDGAKFLALFAAVSKNGQISYAQTVLCGIILAAGTAVGGRRIIRNIADNLVSIDQGGAVASDLASASSLLITSLFGFALSTTHTKNASMIGATYASGKTTDPKETAKLMAAWILTFPVCGALGYALYFLTYTF